jgi:hypothetical protein
MMTAWPFPIYAPSTHIVQEIMSAPVRRMTLCYGVPGDPLLPYIEDYWSTAGWRS